jgi:hypothetical protein
LSPVCHRVAPSPDGSRWQKKMAKEDGHRHASGGGSQGGVNIAMADAGLPLIADVPVGEPVTLAASVRRIAIWLP